jgi:hypothetical protein
LLSKKSGYSNKKKRAAITKMNKKKPKKDRRNFEGLSTTNNKTFLDQKCKLKTWELNISRLS